MTRVDANSLTRPILNRMKEYSPGKPIWEVQQELGLEKVIKLSSNENPLGVSPLAQIAISNAITELHRYPDSHVTRLREAIAKHYEVNINQTIVGNGGDEIITLISETFLEASDEIIIPTPSFSEYEFGANLMGAKVKKISLTEDFEYDVSAILKAVNQNTKLIYLCSPNNPTGTFIKRQDLEFLLRQLPKHILVVFDGAYSQYASHQDYTDGIEFVKKGFSILVLQTFSKIYGLAGIRVGYGISSEDMIQNIQKVREPFNVNALAQSAARAALEDTEHVEKSKSVNEQGRRFLYQSFNDLGLSYIESVSNFILVNTGENAHRIYEALLTKGIIVRYGGVWGLPNYLRITIGTEDENKAFVTALEEIIRKKD